MAFNEPYTGGSINGWPRFSPEAWTAATTATFIIAIGTALTRTGLRVYYFRRLNVDDYIMFVALVALSVTFGMATWLRDIIYAQIAMGLGLMQIPEDWVDDLIRYMGYMNVLSVLSWFTIFAVKISYLVFFWNLIDRMRWMTIWWWTVFSFVLISGVITCVLPTTECTHLDSTMLDYCEYDYIFWREQTDLTINVILDIATDLGVISLPLALIYQVKLNFVRKLAITAILCLSVIMIVIASIRLAFAVLPGTITDTVWLSFWQLIETNVGVTMVSITGFRSLFGQVTRQQTSNWLHRKSSEGSSRRGSSSRNRSFDTPSPFEKRVTIESVIEVSEPMKTYLLPLEDGFERYNVSATSTQRPSRIGAFAALREHQASKPLPPLPPLQPLPSYRIRESVFDECPIKLG